MKKLFVFLFFIVLISCKGQDGTSANTLLADQLVTYYNQNHFDSIFHLFSPEMKSALPLKETVDFFSQMHKDAGGIVQYDFIEKKEFYNCYRAAFSNGVYWLSVSQNTSGKINGLFFSEYDGPGDTPLMIRNTTKLSLPFHGEWFVFWGGDTKEQNYHVISRTQKNAFDLVMVNENGRTYKTNGKTNEDYYAFGQLLIAPCDAIVVSVIKGVEDNVPGKMNPGQSTGNTVVLKTDASEYLLFAHFKLNSIKVNKGDLVKKGQELGLCGNSGNSSEPHLHFHIQDRETPAGSFGVKCYFEKIFVNGKEETDYSPVKGEKIKNASH